MDLVEGENAFGGAYSLRAEAHRRLGGVAQERQRLLQIQLHGVSVVAEVADRDVLAEVTGRALERLTAPERQAIRAAVPALAKLAEQMEEL